MDLNSLLSQAFPSTPDPTRLHAELWADYMSKVLCTWLPLLMTTVIVGRDLFGSGTKCFPVDLTGQDTPPVRNETLIGNTSYAQQASFNGDITDYTRQLAEYVDVYCAKQSHYKETTMFDYQLFTLMLVVQAGVLYFPMLLWNITTARKILCNLRFLMHDTDLLYHCLRGDHAEDRGGYTQSELVKNVNIWRRCNTLYTRYIIKQLVTAVLAILFITVYSTIPSLTAYNIHDEFLCSVKEKFKVDCSVPSATVHRCVWGANLALLCLNVSSIVGHVISLPYNHYYGIRQPFRELGITLDRSEHPLNDGQLIYTFLRANLESIEKYNYVRVLEDVVTEEPPPTNAPGPVPNQSSQLVQYVSTA